MHDAVMTAERKVPSQARRDIASYAKPWSKWGGQQLSTSSEVVNACPIHGTVWESNAGDTKQSSGV